MTRKGKYEPLRDYLDTKDDGRNSIRLTFEQIERIIGERLPRSAYVYSSWWGNRITADYSPPHATAWHEAGWMVADHSLAHRVVEFVRMS